MVLLLRVAHRHRHARYGAMSLHVDYEYIGNPYPVLSVRTLVPGSARASCASITATGAGRARETRTAVHCAVYKSRLDVVYITSLQFNEYSGPAAPPTSRSTSASRHAVPASIAWQCLPTVRASYRDVKPRARARKIRPALELCTKARAGYPTALDASYPLFTPARLSSTPPTLEQAPSSGPKIQTPQSSLVCEARMRPTMRP